MSRPSPLSAPLALVGPALAFVLGFTSPCAGTPGPPTSSPIVESLDTIRQRVDDLRDALRQQIVTEGEHWHGELQTRLDPLLAALDEFLRHTRRFDEPLPGYALRQQLGGLRHAREPQQALALADELAATLRFLCAEHRAAAERSSPTVRTPADEARQVALEILARPEFQQSARPHFFDHYLNRLIARAIARLREAFQGAMLQRATQLAYWFLWSVYAVGGGLLLWWLWRVWTPRRRLRDGGTGTDGSPPVRRGADFYRVEAEKRAREGRFAEAMGACFLMLLATLEERHLVARNRAWTNGEYLRAFARGLPEPSAGEQLSRLNHLFERVRYGGQPCDEEGFVSFRAEVERFLRTIPTQASV